MAKRILNPDVFTDPKMVGQSEYHQIYELLEAHVEQANEDGETAEEMEDQIKAILDEFVTIINDLKKALKSHEPTIIDAEE